MATIVIEGGGGNASDGNDNGCGCGGDKGGDL